MGWKLQGAGRDPYGPDGSANDGHGSDMDVFGRKLTQIITADYTDIALAAGPLDIAGQVRAHAAIRCLTSPYEQTKMSSTSGLLLEDIGSAAPWQDITEVQQD